MIRLFGKIFIFLLLFSTFFTAIPSFARETKLERKANALAIRRILTTLPKISDAYQDPKSTHVEAQRQYAYALKQYKKIEQKFMGLKKKMIEAELNQLGQYVKTTGNSLQVESATKKIMNDLIATFEIPDTPAQKPDPILGADIYKARCSVCHGQDGLVASAIAKKLKPRPKDLVEPPLSENLSPFRIYNVLITGIEDSGKKPMDDQLSDHELWSVAFYTMEMQCTIDASAAPKVEPLTLQALSRSSDRDFASQFRQANSHAALCALRQSYLKNNNVQRK